MEKLTEEPMEELTEDKIYRMFVMELYDSLPREHRDLLKRLNFFDNSDMKKLRGYSIRQIETHIRKQLIKELSRDYLKANNEPDFRMIQLQIKGYMRQ